MDNSVAGVRVVVVDADAVAGWRRARPSVAQLESAVSDLRQQNPGAVISIVGDASLKWALVPEEQERLDDWVNHQQVVLAPAGSRDSHVGFIVAIVDKAASLGMKPVVITDRAVPNCPIVRMIQKQGRWHFDLDDVTFMDPKRAVTAPRRRRRKSGSQVG